MGDYEPAEPETPIHFQLESLANQNFSSAKFGIASFNIALSQGVEN